jgi:hypothetical protein
VAASATTGPGTGCTVHLPPAFVVAISPPAPVDAQMF